MASTLLGGFLQESLPARSGGERSMAPEARSILGVKLDHSKDSPGLKVARHWGRFPRETVARNTIC